MLADDAVVELYPLHVSDAEDDLHEVGRPDTGVFVALPPEGGDLVAWMGEALPVGEVRARFEGRYGRSADLEDFVTELSACGFVRHLDGRPETEPVAPTSRGRELFSGLRADRLGWLRSPVVRILSVTVWVAVPLLLMARPDLFPRASDAWVHDGALANGALLIALSWVLVLLHESAHALAARAVGCPASLSLSHRLYFLVAQTDLSALRAQPRSRRYGPYLAGMTWDLMLLLVCLTLQVTGVRGSLLVALTYLLVMALWFQLACFMRTDVYYALANWLRLGNLMDDTRKVVSNRLRRLVGRPPAHDLGAVPARELRIARGYAWFCAAGVVAAAANLLCFALPLLGHQVSQAASGLGHGPSRAAFWDGALFLAVLAVNVGLLVLVTARDHGWLKRPVAPATAPLDSL